MNYSIFRPSVGRAACVIAAALACAAAFGAPADDDVHHDPLTEVVISGTPLRNNPLETAQPTTVLTGEDLRRDVGASLGETVSGQPGVSSTYYGPVASRPLIRGMGGYRVQMLDDGLGSMDASNLSEDHAVTIESALAQQIEILRGPAALLYGSGGAGGVVNVIGGRLPDRLPDAPLRGTLEVRGDTVLEERTAVGEMDGTHAFGGGGLVLHLDGYRRSTEDVRIPSFAVSQRLRAQLLDAGTEVSDARDRVPNSASDSWGAAAGASWFGTRGSLGLAFNHFDTQYGLPAEEEAFIKMKQDRFDLKGQLDLGEGAFKSLRLRGGYNDYTHTEFEAPGVPGTVFFTKAYELRASADHSLAPGWRGALGAQFAHQDFEALGEEAFVPPTVTRTLGVFAFQERDFGDWTLEGGARLDNQQISPAAAENLPEYDADALNLSLGTLWHVTPADALAVNLTRTQRHPQATELYAQGFHAALGRVELGDATMGKETGYTLDVALRRTAGPVTWNLDAFYNRYSDYVFISPTGGIDPDESVPVYAYQQQDADLYGAEAQLGIPVSAVTRGALALRFTADYLRGRLRSGGNLPAITPYRAGVALDYDLGRLHLGSEAVYHGSQDRVVANELPTDGYTLVALDASYRWPVGNDTLFAFLRATNLLDEEARQHASPLKDIVPLPGRGLRLGLRMQF